jgi:hypothetical protein
MRGDVTINVIISGLFAIGVAAFIVLILFKHFQEIHILNMQARSERDAFYLANALISHEKIVYEKDGIRYRGVLDSKKLDEIFIKSNKGIDEDFIRQTINPSNLITLEKLDLSYPNSISWIYIIDIDRCNEKECLVWGGATVSLTKDILFDNPVTNFATCSFGVIMSRVPKGCVAFAPLGVVAGKWVLGVGAIIGGAAACAIGSVTFFVLSAGEIVECFKQSGEFIRNLFQTGSPIGKRGLPVNIIYEDGSIHKGRVIVAILEWTK